MDAKKEEGNIQDIRRPSHAERVAQNDACGGMLRIMLPLYFVKRTPKQWSQTLYADAMLLLNPI